MDTLGQALVIYNSIILFLLLVILINFLINLKKFKPISEYKINILYWQILPKVSVLVPARNESKNIEKCINSLLNQYYKNMEIIVLDDNSSDNTYAIVKKIIEEYRLASSSKNSKNREDKKEIKLISGLPLKNGWIGKNFACYQLEKEASGDYLLFTDADTEHSPESISCGVQCLISNNLDGLSVYPEMIFGSFFERMIIGFMKFGILAFLPLYLKTKIKNPLFSTALGSYMLYKRKIYLAVGGHEAIYNRCLEDMNMANLIKSKGYRFQIFDGFKTYKTRMYSNIADIAKGFSRFILTTFNYKKILPFFLVFLITVLLLFPFIELFIYPIFYAPFISIEAPISILESFIYNALLLNLLQVSIILILKTIYITRFEGNIIDIILHPISIGIIFFMGLYLSLGGKKTSTISWKGRNYSLNNQNLKA